MGKTKTKKILTGADDYGIWLAKFDAAMRKDERYDDLFDHGDDLEQIWLQRRVKKYDTILERRDQMKTRLLLLTDLDEKSAKESSEYDSGDSGLGSEMTEEEAITASPNRLLGEEEAKQRDNDRHVMIEEACIAIQKKVRKTKRDLYSEIIEAISDELVGRLNRECKNDGLQAMRLLGEKFAGKDKVRVKQLKAELMNIKPEDYKLFTDFMDAMMVIYHELTIMGKPPDTDSIQISIQEHIPESCASIITVLSETDPDLEFEDWMKRVEKHCATAVKLNRKHKKVPAKQTVKFEDTRPADTTSTSTSVKCQICKQEGHPAWKCKFRYSNSEGMPKGQNPFIKKCHYCGDTTHLVRDCPKKQADKNKVIDTASSKQLKKAYQAACKREDKSKAKEKKKGKEKVAAKKANKKKTKKKATPPTSSSSSELSVEESEESDASTTSTSEESSSEEVASCPSSSDEGDPRQKIACAVRVIKVNETVSKSHMMKLPKEWSKSDVEKGITNSKLRSKSHMNIDLLQDGGSGDIIVPSLDHCYEILEILPDIIIQVANDQNTQVIAVGMMKMRVECEGGDSVTTQVRVLVAPGITTVLWSVDVALDEYGIATMYDNHPCPRVTFPDGKYHKLHKKQGCRWMVAKVTMAGLGGKTVRAKAGKVKSNCSPSEYNPSKVSAGKPKSKNSKIDSTGKFSDVKISNNLKGKPTEVEVQVANNEKVSRREELMAIREESEKRKGGKPTDKSRLLWHRRLRHSCDRRLDMTCLAVDFMRISPKDQSCPCIVCKLANMKQLKYLIGSAVTTDPMDIVNIDWIGPITPPACLTGERHILSFTIKNTKFRATGFAVTRDGAPALTQGFVLQFGMMKKLRMDNAKEFNSKEVKDFCNHIEEFCQDNALQFTLKEGQGIQMQYTCKYAHGQGGSHERTNGLLLEGARATMMEANEEPDQWMRAVKMDTTTINMVANKSLNWITPYEEQYQVRPDASMLKVPFSMCYVSAMCGCHMK